MNLINRLKDSTSILHDKTEASPVARSVANGTIKKNRYLKLLQFLWQLHSEAESEFVRLRRLLLPFRDSMLRCRSILNDLKFFETEIDSTRHPLVKDWLEEMHAHAESHPEIWLGALYVLEGSRNGSKFLARSLCKAFNLSVDSNQGLTYHLQDVDSLEMRWREFRTDCDALEWTETAKSSAVEGAVLTFQVIHDAYISIQPIHETVSV